MLSALICTRSYLTTVMRWLQNLSLSFFLQLRLLFLPVGYFYLLPYCLQKLSVSKSKSSSRNKLHGLNSVTGSGTVVHLPPKFSHDWFFHSPFPIYLGTKVCILIFLTKFGKCWFIELIGWVVICMFFKLAKCRGVWNSIFYFFNRVFVVAII